MVRSCCCDKVRPCESLYHGSYNGLSGGRSILYSAGSLATVSTYNYFGAVSSTSTPRQSKEKSRGIWVELPLSELEQKYNTPEDREWLQKQVVARRGPSIRKHVWGSYSNVCPNTVRSQSLNFSRSSRDSPSSGAHRAVSRHTSIPTVLALVPGSDKSQEADLQSLREV